MPSRGDHTSILARYKARVGKMLPPIEHFPCFHDAITVSITGIRAAADSNATNRDISISLTPKCRGIRHVSRQRHVTALEGSDGSYVGTCVSREFSKLR